MKSIENGVLLIEAKTSDEKEKVDGSTTEGVENNQEPTKESDKEKNPGAELGKAINELRVFLAESGEKNTFEIRVNIEDAEKAKKYLEDKNKDGEYEEEISDLSEIIEQLKDVLKIRELKEQINSERRDEEEARDFIERFQKEHKKAQEEILYCTRALRILESSGKGLDEEEKKEYEGLVKSGITKEELEEKTRQAANRIGVLTATKAERASSKGIDSQLESGVIDSEALHKLVIAFSDTMKEMRESIGIETNGMLREQRENVGRIKKEEENKFENTHGSGGSSDDEPVDVMGDTPEGWPQSAKQSPEKEKENKAAGVPEGKDILIESSNYHRLFEFFREETEKSEIKNEAASLLINADRRAFAEEILDLPDRFYKIEKHIELDPKDDARKIGIIVVELKNPNNFKFDKKVIIKVAFNDSEDSGILSSFRRAFTSEEKSISISISEEYLADNKQNTQEEKEQEGDGNEGDSNAVIDIMGESIKNPLTEDGQNEINPGKSEELGTADPEIETGDLGVSETGQKVKVEPGSEKNEQKTATEVESGNKKIEGMTFSEIYKSSDLLSKTELLSNNSFILSIGAGVNFLGEDSSSSLERVAKILYFEDEDSAGQSITDSLERGSMKAGNYIIIEKIHEERYYILSVKDGQAPLLRKMRAPEDMILTPKENPAGRSIFGSFFDQIVGTGKPGDPTTSA